MKYRRKPPIVEAWPVSEIITGAVVNWLGLPQDAREWTKTDTYVMVPTPDGAVRALLGDMVVRGPAGDFRVASISVFEALYEPL